MGNKLFVGNLSWQATADDLRSAFAQAGTVTDAMVAMDRMTGKSRGFGFVTMSTEEEAQRAIEMMDGADLMGRPVAVSIARPLEDRPPRRDFSSRPPRDNNNW